MLRRIVGARVGHHPSAEDLVQETLVRVLAARDRIEPGMLEPYAIATARNLVATHVAPAGPRAAQPAPGRSTSASRERPARTSSSPPRSSAAIAAALRSASTSGNGEILLAHEVDGQDTGALGRASRHAPRAPSRRSSTAPGPGCGSSTCWRSSSVEPPTDRCRPVLLALSSGDRRRQREVDAARHLLECELCARLSEPLLDRGPRARRRGPGADHAATPDIVAARQAARELAARAGFSGTDLTLIATAVSEIARNIVRFAGAGEIVVELLERAAAAASGSSPATPARASPTSSRRCSDGYSTYDGPGPRAARRPPADGRVRRSSPRSGGAPP